jgi:hypothetical protein
LKKEYYLAYVNYRNFGIAIKKINFIKEIQPGSNFICGMPEIIWHFGNVDTEENQRPTFYNRNNLHEKLEDCVAKLYTSIDKLIESMKNRHDGNLQNIKIAEDILREEKEEALKSGKELKRVSNSLKNLNIEKQLERLGII